MRGRSLVVATVLVASAIVASALLFRGGGDDGGAGEAPPDDARAAPTSLAGRPRPLVSKKDEGLALKVGARGCSVIGSVRRDGKPAAAAVELRRVETSEHADVRERGGRSAFDNDRGARLLARATEPSVASISA